MKVYIVGYPVEEDMRIQGVYSTREGAEECVRWLREDDIKNHFGKGLQSFVIEEHDVESSSNDRTD